MPDPAPTSTADVLPGTLGRLVDAGHLVPMGEPGLYGLGVQFEGIAEAVSAGLVRAAQVESPTVVRFPPVLPRAVFERTGYLSSFPHLFGSVHVFGGRDEDHRRLLKEHEAGDDWSADLRPSSTMLCSAACHPLYPTVASPLPPGGRVWDVQGWVFRHEPSLDPARLQAFRQHEIVYIGDADGAHRHAQVWLERAAQMLADFDLEISREVASDPFFGRAGRLLAAGQIEGATKVELLGATSEEQPATALASVNEHGSHFGSRFGISTSSSEPAYSACLGVGLERVALALLWRHGMDVAAWPGPVRDRLWPASAHSTAGSRP